MRPTFTPQSFYTVLYGLLLSCAGCTSYQAKPLDPSANVERIQNKQVQSASFEQFVKRLNPNVSWPIQTWDLTSLTYSALHHHSDLDVAKADYAVSLAAVKTAGIRQQVGVNGLVAKSNQANGDIRPWSYGLQIDLPIELGNKRKVQIEAALHQVEVAKINVAETAWRLRHQLSSDLINQTEIQALQANTQDMLQFQDALLASYEKRLSVGMTSKPELYQIKIQRDQTAWKLQQYIHQSAQIEQKIVHDAGLVSVTHLDIQPLDIATWLDTQKTLFSQINGAQDVQHYALTNRMDIQRGIAMYAVAESKLKLEFAKKIPDISLSPGVLYEYGDRIWSLGIGSLLNLLNRPSTLTHEAEKIRDKEAASFMQLQQSVIQLSQSAYQDYQQSQLALAQLLQDQKLQPLWLDRMRHQWENGLIDKTEWLQSQLQVKSAQQRVIQQQIAVLRAMLALENVMQRPILLSEQQLPQLIE
jgi:outer membrane protein, heavy metal efflux system